RFGPFTHCRPGPAPRPREISLPNPLVDKSFRPPDSFHPAGDELKRVKASAETQPARRAPQGARRAGMTFPPDRYSSLLSLSSSSLAVSAAFVLGYFLITLFFRYSFACVSLPASRSSLANFRALLAVFSSFSPSSSVGAGLGSSFLGSSFLGVSFLGVS